MVALRRTLPFKSVSLLSQHRGALILTLAAPCVLGPFFLMLSLSKYEDRSVRRARPELSSPFDRLRMRTRGAENQMGLLNAIHELSSVNLSIRSDFNQLSQAPDES